MISMDRLTRALIELFGEDAALTTQTYVQTMRALHAMAVAAGEQNTNRARQGLPALAYVYAGEADAFADVAQELRRATARVNDILDGVISSSPTGEGEDECNS